MDVIIGSDHRGFQLKSYLKGVSVFDTHISWVDVGAETYDEEDDYVDFAKTVARMLHSQPNSFAVVLCGSGVGISIAMNRYRCIRCALVSSPQQAVAAREDDNCNVLALAADFIDHDIAIQIIESFVTTPYKATERFERRLRKIETIGGADV